MVSTVFQVVPAAGGWRLLDNGKPAFWFPEMDSAMQTAQVMADARATFNGERASVQRQVGVGEFVQVAAYG